jgi:hypothetical protein
MVQGTRILDFSQRDPTPASHSCGGLLRLWQTGLSTSLRRLFAPLWLQYGSATRSL